MASEKTSRGGYESGSPVPANYGLDLDLSYLGRLRRYHAVSMPGTLPQDPRRDIAAEIGSRIGRLIEQRHAQGEAFMDFKIALLQEEVARARVQTIPGELREDFMQAIGLPVVAEPSTPEKQRRPRTVREAVAQLRVGAEPANSIEVRGEAPNY
jgi:hypothetical protein